MAKKTSRENKINKEVEQINKKINDSLIEDTLKNNIAEFEIDNIKYKIEKPNHKVKTEAYRMKTEKYLSLLSEKNENGTFKYMLEDDLKEMYKDRGIDIDKLNLKITELQNKKRKFSIKIGELLANKKNISDIETYEKELNLLGEEERKISIKKHKLLEYSIEQQVLIYVFTYLIFLSALTLNKKGQWVRLWETYDKFETEDEKIINNVSFNATFILKDELSIEF